MADTSFNLTDPTPLVPAAFSAAFKGWLYAVFLRLNTAIKFSVQKTATQSITNNTATKVTWSTTIGNDSIGGWSTTNNRYIAQIPGTYFFNTAVLLSGALEAGEYLKVMLYVNNAVVRTTETLAMTTTSTTARISAQIDLNQGDYVEVFVHHTVGGATNIAAAPEHTYFQGHRIN